jgi:cytochrome b6
MILALHLFFVQMQGMSEPMETQTSTAPRRTIPFLPDFALRDLLVWLVVFDLLIALSVFFPWELGTKADPFVSAPAGIKPEWYFLFVFQALKMLPAHIGPFEGELVGLTFLGIGGLALVLVPFLDRAAAKNLRNRWFDLAGALALGFFAIFTVLGYILD